MKKIIALATLLLAFTINVNAQEKKMSPQESAKNDITALAAKVKMSETLQQDLITLMTMKHETMSDASLSNEKKEHARQAYEHKLMSGLTADQRTELMKYPALVKQLIH
jgi:hypothetical protein